MTNILFTGLCYDHLSILRDSHTSREIITCGKDTSLQWETKEEPAPSSGTEFERLRVKFYSIVMAATTVDSSCLHSVSTKLRSTINRNV